MQVRGEFSHMGCPWAVRAAVRPLRSEPERTAAPRASGGGVVSDTECAAGVLFSTLCFPSQASAQKRTKVVDCFKSCLESFITKSQSRTGHTREPDPTHLKLKHETTRGTPTHESTYDAPNRKIHTGSTISNNRFTNAATGQTGTRDPAQSHTHILHAQYLDVGSNGRRHRPSVCVGRDGAQSVRGASFASFVRVGGVGCVPRWHKT